MKSKIRKCRMPFPASHAAWTVCTAVLAAGLSFALYGQTPYDDIKEGDLRIEEIKGSLIGGQIPDQPFRLRYSGTRGDYLLFYDRMNQYMLFRYREDRFDRDAEKKIRHLIAGHPYSVTGEFTGVLLKERYYPSSHPDFPGFIKSPDAVLVFDYTDAKIIKTEQILLGKGQRFFHLHFPYSFIVPVRSRAEIRPDGAGMTAEIYSADRDIFLVTLFSIPLPAEPKFEEKNCRASAADNASGEVLCSFPENGLLRKIRYIKDSRRLNFFTLSVPAASPETADSILNSLELYPLT